MRERNLTHYYFPQKATEEFILEKDILYIFKQMYAK
jgi:hypothetical protein